VIDGSWAAPHLAGAFAIHEGKMHIDTLGIDLNGITANGRYRGDTLWIMSADANGPRGGTARVTGYVGFKKWYPDWFDLNLSMQNFEIYNRPELAQVNATTNTRDSGAVRLFGSMAHDSLTGWVSINRSSIFLPDPKVSAKLIKEQVITPPLNSTSGANDVTLLDRITENLSTDLRLHIGTDVKLSADYADIPLSGDVRIMPITVFSATANKGAGAFINRLAPEGTVFADRGTYSLDFGGLFRRDLAVEKGGTITFDRDADWNPLLNLSTRYNATSAGHAPIPVIVDVKGRLLPRPQLSFRTDAPFPISESDLVSYLLTGQPGFDLAAQSTDYKNLVASVLAPTVSSTLSNQLRDKLGSNIRLAVESASPTLTGTQAGAIGQGFLQFVYSTRVSGEVQLSDKMYLSVKSSGLCLADQSYRESVSKSNLLSQLGLAGNLEYRLSSALRSGSSLQASSEPSTQTLLCSPSADLALRGAAPTPRQYSLSYLKYWRW
ncbi:MAG TPA: translocation/assembly module TamB domain-containing protein, partial [Gemmatimonadaceae bacterium]